MRFCRKCREWLPVAAFYPHSPGRIRHCCKYCDGRRLAAYRRERREGKPDLRKLAEWPAGYVRRDIATKRARSRLSDERVEEMRRLHEHGVAVRDLADRFPEVSRSMIDKVVHFRARL